MSTVKSVRTLGRSKCTAPKAPWGKPAENGLRIAWLLEPRAETRALDSVMKSRVLFHNAGKAPVCFATEDWIQTGTHKAKDASGKDISVWAISRMGLRTRMIFRLAPGEYAEVEGHGLGVGVGSHETSSETSIYQVGCWIEAQQGDAVTFTPGSVPVSFQTWRDNEGLKDSVTVWQEMIAARFMHESPMPAAAADRELLLRRVMRDFPGTAPTAEQIAAFVTDNAPDALVRLIKSLQARAAAMHFAGELSGGETKFRVLPADPDAAKKPRTANNPGHYTLSDQASLQVSRRGVGERIVNEAHLSLSAPGKRHDITLPDGYDTWAAGWVRGTTVIWITQKGLLRKIDFTNLTKVEETHFEADKVTTAPIPPDIREALRAALTAPDAPKPPPPLNPKPAAPAAATPK